MIPRLEADGLIKAVSQRGLQIMRIDLPMVHDAFGLREMIEAAAIVAFVRRASTTRSAPTASDWSVSLRPRLKP